MIEVAARSVRHLEGATGKTGAPGPVTAGAVRSPPLPAAAPAPPRRPFGR